MKNTFKRHWVTIFAIITLILVVGFYGAGNIFDGQSAPTPVTQETLDRLAATLKDPYSIQDGQIYYQGTLMEGVDVGTFEPFPDPNLSYSKDKNYVYYVTKILDGADPATFEFFYPDYFGLARDKNRVYIQETVIDGADPSTFEVIKGTGYFKDKSHVFVGTEQIPQADPATFEPVPLASWNWAENKVETIYRPYGKDKNAVYFASGYEDDSKPHAIPNSDPTTLEQVKDQRGATIYLRDKNLVYDLRKGGIQGSDPATYQLLSSGYSRDARSVYFENKKISNAELATFRVLGNWFAEDKNYLYEEEQVIFSKSRGASPFELAAARLKTFVPNDDTAIDVIVATYYDLTLFYGSYSAYSIFDRAEVSSSLEFFESLYKDLDSEMLRGIDAKMATFPAFRLAFIDQSAPAFTFELPFSGGAASGGTVVGRKLLDESTMLVYAEYEWQEHLGPSSYMCKEHGSVIDKFVFKRVGNEWKIWEIEESIDSWQTGERVDEVQDCKPINQDKINKYKL